MSEFNEDKSNEDLYLNLLVKFFDIILHDNYR